MTAGRRNWIAIPFGTLEPSVHLVVVPNLREHFLPQSLAQGRSTSSDVASPGPWAASGYADISASMSLPCREKLKVSKPSLVIEPV